MPDSGSAHACLKLTCSSAWMARSAWWASCSASWVTPFIEVCTSMNSGIVCPPFIAATLSSAKGWRQWSERRGLDLAERSHAADALTASGLLVERLVLEQVQDGHAEL